MRVLYLDIDTLRPDHMGAYGYHRDTTPNLDRVAEDGVRFDRVYCSDAPCLPSRAALITGRFGIHNFAVGHGGTCADRRLYGAARGFSDPQDAGNFNHIFRRAGLYTASISTFAERHSSAWYTAGFHETHNVGKCGGESAEEVLPVALDWLERNGRRDNWYLHLHLWDPHTPYRTPQDWRNPFEEKPTGTWITRELFDAHKRMVAPHGLNEIGMYTDQENPRYPKHPGSIQTYDGLRRVLDGYDGGVRYADEMLGRVLDWLRARGIYEDTAIIVTSDHGESLGEFGAYGEHGLADESTCHIPLIIKWPGGRRGAADDGFHYLLDLAPTMASLLGVDANPDWDGQSFAGSVSGGEAAGRAHLILSQMAHVCQRAARFGDYLYIRTVHDGYRLLNRDLLFDLARDPHELRDLSDARPELVNQGAKLILDWQEDMMRSSQEAADPMWVVMREGGPYHTVGELPGYLEHLERTGRHEGAEALRRRYPRESRGK